MMKMMIFFAFLLVIFVFAGRQAGELSPVSDAVVDADLTQIQTNTLVPMEAEVQATAATVADTLTTAPADSVGEIVVLDEGEVATPETEATEFMPAVADTGVFLKPASAQLSEGDADVFAADPARDNPVDPIF